MLKIAILFFLTLPITEIIAQSWAPVGARWYFSHNGGAPPELTVIESIGDTTVESKQCKILETYMVYRVMDSAGFYSWDTLFCPLQYTYEQSGIVYLFDETSGNFDILYNFNASQGDTITVKDSPFNGYCPETVPSGLFEYVIDEVTDSLIYGVMLKKQTVTPTINADWIFTDPFSSNNYPVIEVIGSTKFLFGVPAFQVMEGSINCLRCYKDSLLSYKSPSWPDTLPCNYLQPINNNGVILINENHQIQIYPNPAQHFLNIIIPVIEGSEYTIGIYSVTGSLQLHGKTKEKVTQVGISNLPTGLYFIRVANDRSVFLGKFVRE